MLKKVIEIATFPMYLNIYNIVDKAEKVINKVAELETSKIVSSKELKEAKYVENVVC